MTFGEKIREARLEKSMSQNQVALKLGVNRRTLGNWETGAREPSIEMIRKLALVLDCDANYLLGIVGYDGVRTTLNSL